MAPAFPAGSTTSGVQGAIAPRRIAHSKDAAHHVGRAVVKRKQGMKDYRQDNTGRLGLGRTGRISRSISTNPENPVYPVKKSYRSWQAIRNPARRGTSPQLAPPKAGSAIPRDAGRVRNLPRQRRGPQSAFTLLEVLLAMGIVTMLVLMIANMFQEVSASCSIGTQSAERNTAGRAGVDFIARELSQAVAGPIEAAQPPPGHPNIRFQLLNGNELQFVALSGDPQVGRALRGAFFYYDNVKKTLQYTNSPSAFNPYNADPSFSGAGQMLITNVTDFYLTAYTNANDLINKQNSTPDYDSLAASNRLPVCVDIYLEVLGNDDAKKAAAGGADFINRNARRYTTRVYFHNR